MYCEIFLIIQRYIKDTAKTTRWIPL